jgi:hypothetical protein
VGIKRLEVRTGVVAALAVSVGLASNASAAFPGHNGMLAVQPLHGNGIVLVGSNGRGERRICISVSVCGHPGRPQFSPDGRSILFAGPAVRLVGTDGLCQNCQFGAGIAPAFRGNGTLVTFASGVTMFEDGIDGIRQGEVVGPLSVRFQAISDAAWSVRGTVAVAAGGRIWIGKPDVLRVIGRGSFPSWSPDGSRIAFVRRGWIIVLRVSGGASRRVVRGTAPAFSPDGRSIAFVDGRRRVEVISSSGGRARPVGQVRGLAVDWQPLPSHPASCVPPPGAKVLARSSQAVVTTETGPNPGYPLSPATAVMGCLTANGRERLLESSMSNNVDGATAYPMASVGGAYAGVVVDNYDDHYYGDASKSVDVFDLRTAARSGFGGESSGCQHFAPTLCGIDQVVVGQNGVSAVHVYPAEQQDEIGVSCASAAFCVAYDVFGDVSASTDPPDGRWSSANVARPRQLQRMSCPSTALCVGVDGSASVYVSGNPIGGSSTWTKTQIPSVQYISDVSCPSTTLCVASASGGNLLVSTDPTGGPSAWSVDAVDGTNNLSAVSCPTTSECFVVAGYGDVISSSNPTGGAGAWTVRHLGLGALQQISCPSSSLCLAVPMFLPTGLLVSTDPAVGPWTTTNSSFPARDVSCPSTSLCVAVGGSGVSVSTDPSSGEWTTYGLSNTPQSVSCPTTSFCAIGGIGTGYAFTSTDPAAGTDAWKPVLADPIDCTTTPLACATEQIIASDRTGVHTLDSSTEFEAQTGPQLTGLALSGDTLSWNAHGSPASAQLKP